MNEFHAHLDECAWCCEHPFDLCAEGQRLIELALKKAPVIFGVDWGIDEKPRIDKARARD